MNPASGQLLQLALIMTRLALISIGGGTAQLGQMEHELVGRGWISDTQFIDAYALGQLAPGPGIAFAVPIGFEVAGAAGALVALLMYFVPTTMLALAFAHVWQRIRFSPWPVAFRTAMAPVVVGLTWGSVYALVAAGLGDFVSLAIGGVALFLLLRTRVATPLVLLGGAAVGITTSLLGH